MTRMTARSTAALLACLGAAPALATTPEEVVANYAAIGEAVFGDAASTAQGLQVAVDALIAAPSDETLQAARAAWKAARVPYLQSEVFRFGNPVVDAWEGRVNSWPLDEGLIDYVDEGSYIGPSDENPLASANVVASTSMRVGGKDVDLSQITPALIAGTLHQADGIETNVASGYHAVEFMLWGQDLNGTGPGAGNRPWTDYLQGEGCTGGNCDRRAAYLKAVTDLLAADMAEMAADWAPGGAARAVVTGDAQAGVSAILTGMGSLSYGELAGERIKLGLMLHDPEEEQDCFSDNTANSHYYDGLGIRNIYLGRYVRVDGSTVTGASVSDLVAASDPAVDAAVKERLEATMAALGAMQARADAGMAYDQMLAPGNAEGAALITATVDALVAQTREIERAVKALKLGDVAVEGSDSLDNPGAVFQ